MQVTVGDVRQRLGEIIDRVTDGDEVVVTRRGARVAAIVPAPDDATATRDRVGLAARAGALGRLDGLEEAVATVVSLRSVARDREPPGVV